MLTTSAFARGWTQCACLSSAMLFLGLTSAPLVVCVCRAIALATEASLKQIADATETLKQDLVCVCASLMCVVSPSRVFSPPLLRLQSAEVAAARSEAGALRTALDSERAALASLQASAAEAAGKAEADVAGLRHELGLVNDAAGAAGKEAEAAKARVAQLLADSKVLQEARKSAEAKYQTQLQVRASLPFPWVLFPTCPSFPSACVPPAVP